MEEAKDDWRASILAKKDSDREFTKVLRESTRVCIWAIALGCESGIDSAGGGGGEAVGLSRSLEEPLDLRDLRIFAYKRTSSSGQSTHSSQWVSMVQSNPRHAKQMVWRSAVLALILLGQATHLLLLSGGGSTEESDDGGEDPASAVKPGSSKLTPLITDLLITVKTKRYHIRGEQWTCKLSSSSPLITKKAQERPCRRRTMNRKLSSSSPPPLFHRTTVI